MKRELFTDIPVLQRGSKPRQSGLTVIYEERLGITGQEDFLSLCGEYVDLAKIGVGTSMLMDSDILKEKIRSYHDHEVTVFPGGQFLEYVIAQNKTQEYFSAVREAGYKMVEVSDNLIDISLEIKTDLIKTAIQDFGLKVLGETGSKKVASDREKLLEDINACLDAGAWRVMFEAAELFDNGAFKAEFAKSIFEAVESEKVIFELPGYWIANTTEADVYKCQCWLIDNFGPEVNIGNVNTDHIMNLEAERLNLGTSMKF